MNKKLGLNIKKNKLSWLLASIVVFALVGVFISNTLRKSDSVSAQSVYVSQDISKADFDSQQNFSLQAEQDEDTPLKILDAKVEIISGDQFQRLTSEKAGSEEVISVPKVILQNVSNKTIVGVTLFIVDKATQTKKGYYLREQSIKPGQELNILPENLVRAGENPAKNPKFWLDAKDKSQVSVRVVAFFEDGSMWANKNQRY